MALTFQATILDHKLHCIPEKSNCFCVEALPEKVSLSVSRSREPVGIILSPAA